MRTDIFSEIRLYLTVLWRRWPFALVPALVVAALGVVTFSLPQSSYRTSVQHIVSQDPTVSADSNEESRRFVWINSQYVVNTITDWSNGSEFAGRVALEMQTAGHDVTTETVVNALETGTIRSKLEVYIDHSDEEIVEAMAQAATVVLNRDNLEAIPQLGEDPAFITPIDEIIVEEIAPGLSSFLDLPIRLAVAVGAGLAVALFAEYVDPKVRSRQQVSMMNLPIIGEIPAE